MKPYTLMLCGAFTATVKPRKGETDDQACERVELAINSALDRYAKRYQCSIGVDYGAIEKKAKP